MSLQQSLGNSIVWRGIYFLVVAAVNMVASRLLGAELAGWLYYFFNVGALVLLVVSFSAESALTYYYSKRILTISQVASLAAIIALASSFLQAIVWLFILPHLPAIHFFEYWQLWLLGSAYVVGNMVVTFYNQLFIATNQVKKPPQVLAIGNLLLLLSFGLFPSSKAVIISYCTAYIIQAGIMYWLFFNTYQITFNWRVGISKTIFWGFAKYACLAMLANLVFFLVYRIDNFFLQYYNISALQIGNYLQAAKFAQLLLILPQIIAAILFPATAQQQAIDSIKPTIFVFARLLLQVFLVLAVASLLLGNWFFTSVLGHSFSFTNTYLLSLLPGIYCLCVLALFSAYLSGKGLVKINLMAAAVALVVAVLLNIIWVPKYGAFGCVWASVVSYFVNTAIAFFAIHYHFSLPKNWWKPQKGDYFWLQNFLK